MRICLAVLCILCFTLIECTQHRFAPAQAARTGPGQDSGRADVNGIDIVANGDAWSGEPKHLGRLLTPVKVSIENHGESPLLIVYRNFSLENGPGFHAAARAAIKTSSTTIQPRFDQSGFYVAPDSAFYGPGLSAWPYQFPPDLNSKGKDDYWKEATPDMIANGIPEGVLEPSGHISGFLYFQQVPKNVDSIDFAAKLVHARTGALLGTARIPLVRKSLPALIP